MNATTPSTTTALWARLRAVFARAFAAAPALIANAILRVVIVSRLRMLETLTRKLLLAEASALNLFENAAPRVVKPRASPVRRVASATRSTPFSLRLPREPRTSRRRSSHSRNFWHAPAPSHPSAMKIAQRIEALRDVLNDPAPFARRLARALAKAHARLPNIMNRCALFSPHRYVADPHDPSISRDIVATVLAATVSIPDSS